MFLVHIAWGDIGGNPIELLHNDDLLLLSPFLLHSSSKFPQDEFVLTLSVLGCVLYLGLSQAVLL